MFREFAYGIAGLWLLGHALDYLFSLADDPREPPRVRHKVVPVIGHVIGLLRHGPTYYKYTSDAADAEIYSLDVLSFKVYISASSRLLPLIQKHSRALSFRPFLELTARKYGDASEVAHAIYAGSLPDDLSQAVKATLAPGPHLDSLSLRMGNRVLLEIDRLVPNPGTPKATYLLRWARHAVVQATSCAVYGDDHPFVDPDVENAYWKWMTYLSAHLVGWADITGRGYALRHKVFKAYAHYCRVLPGYASQLMKEHQRVLGEAGVPDDDKAKQAAIFTIASFSNSAPTLYWTLWELFSRPEVLAQVRQELEAHAVAIVAGGKHRTTATPAQECDFVLDVAAVKTKCALLLSVFQETQRTRHVNPSFRKVMSDVLLDGKYLLKKGRYLQVPGNVIHGERGIWGDSASEFDPYRFVPAAGDDAKGRPVPTAAAGTGAAASGFVPWGAAPYLCPARQFAATEILIVVALLALRADIRPAAGTWDRTPALNVSDLSTLSPPKADVEMEVNARPGWVGRWGLHMGESRSRVPLASG
ncbi:hypothetical protein RB595_006939 [Gaeumannomyces hyphopodioides]